MALVRLFCISGNKHHRRYCTKDYIGLINKSNSSQHVSTFPWSHSTVILQRLFHSLYRERQLFNSIYYARNITHTHQQEQEQEQEHHIPISRISRWEWPRRWHRSRRSRSSSRRRWSRRSRSRPHRTRWTWSSSWRRRRRRRSRPGWSCRSRSRTPPLPPSPLLKLPRSQQIKIKRANEEGKPS